MSGDAGGEAPDGAGPSGDRQAGRPGRARGTARAGRDGRAVPARLEASVDVAAPREAVWAVVSDLARMAEFSPELRRAWVLGAGSPRPGTRVLGVNRRGAVVWPTLSRVVRWEPGRAVAWHTRESGATWIYELADAAPSGAGEPGTVLTARRELDRFGLATTLIGPLIGGAEGHDEELGRGLAATLDRIRAAVVRTPA